MFDGAEFVARVLFFVKDEGEKESFLAKVQ
jgi:hypothetical protein